MTGRTNEKLEMLCKAQYDPNGAVAQSGGIEAYVSDVVGDIDTVLDEVNGEVV